MLADAIIVLAAILANLLLAGMFLARARRRDALARGLGTSVVLLGVVVAAALLSNLAQRRAWWTVALPALFVAHAAVELLLDYVLRVPFRQTRLLWPYLLLYYAALMALIGYAFLAAGAWGYVVLVTYFVGLGATWYSFRKVGHGRDAASAG